MLKRPPALGQKREAALAQAADLPQRRVASPGINVELLDPSGLLHRYVDAVTCTFVAGIGQHWHRVQERPQHAQDIFPGRGQVMDIARQDIGKPQRDPRSHVISIADLRRTHSPRATSCRTISRFRFLTVAELARKSRRRGRKDPPRTVPDLRAGFWTSARPGTGTPAT